MDTCQPISAVLGIAVVLSIGSSSLLFLFRVRAVYMKSVRITAVFGLLWLATVAVAILTDVNIRTGSCRPFTTCRALIVPLPAHLLGTNICVDKNPTRYRLQVYATFLNDTTVFLAITYRLTADAAVGDDWRSRLLSVVRGRGLHQLSRSLLQSGQLYYL